MRDKTESHKRLVYYIAKVVFTKHAAVKNKRAFQLLYRAARSRGLRR